jgi:hypothetical protein
MTHKLTHLTIALLGLLLMAGAALAADPGLPVPDASEASDQKAGSVLYYNSYTSSATAPNTQNARLNITNTSASQSATVHLFFVDGGTGGVADSFICLTANQTATIIASDVDPGVSGYMIAVAVDPESGLPTKFNFLIGDEFVKFSTGHSANLGAVAFSKINDENVTSGDGSIAILFFDALPLPGSYSRAPRVVAVDNIASRGDGNDTLLILNRVGGNLATGAAGLGSLFGLVYDDAESVFSFSITGGAQLRASLSNSFPRTTPRLDQIIPAGRSGWMKIFSQADIGIVGAAITANPNAGTSAGAFNSGHNLHHLRLSGGATLILPVFPPAC